MLNVLLLDLRSFDCGKRKLMEQCNGITLKGVRCKRQLKTTAANTIEGKTYCGVHYKLVKPVIAPVEGIPTYLKQLIPEDILPHVGTFSIQELEFIFLNKDELPALPIPEDQADGLKVFECQCCINECFQKDLISCSNDHQFCHDCLTNYVTDRITHGDYKLRCMADANCDGSFNHKILKNILDEKLYNAYAEKETQEILNLAEIKDLYTCPKCMVYSIVLEESYRKSLKEPKFVCVNSQCCYISCLLCKGKFHGYVACDYVKKDENVRKVIEEILTRHRTRLCPKCSKEFMRIDGCNKMTCSCKTVSCYLCKAQIIGYGHFYDRVKNNKATCPLYTKETDIINQSVTLAIKEIYERYKNDKIKLDSDVYPILCKLEKEHIELINLHFKRVQKKSWCVIL
ncbi:MAG: hypothetical protein Harvfovirus1_10 [Harvfovirus sp.]|uniref:RING-type domain-containing protein n=1 Tax=Harvfovirus sp. TaxID=2487768 RepID=A0A3G4ZZN3_9VIRU|nr:MAG: hypothetical protein Harvfovirus1_10 [Harvfovirus sp.]